MNRTGWAYGTTDGGQWLTILGSHWKAPKLADTPESAERPELGEWYADRLILAKVEQVWHPGVASGRAYKIIERA